MKRRLLKWTLTAFVAVGGLFLCGSRPLSNTCCSSNGIALTAQSIKKDFSNTDIQSELEKVNSLWLIEISSDN